MTSEILLGNKHYAMVGIANADRYAANGYAWRMSTGVATLASAGSTYISINAITANIGDWIVKQTVSDGLSESEIYTIWTNDLFVKYFKV